MKGIGALMLLALPIAYTTAMVLSIGWIGAATVWGIILGLIGWIGAAMWLVNRA